MDGVNNLLLTLRAENMALRMFLQSLLQAHPNRPAALAQLARQLEDAKEEGLFRARTDEENAAFARAAEGLLTEFRHDIGAHPRF